MKPNPLSEYFQFASETAYLAGRLTLGYYQTGVQADFKADDTPVTVADRKAEELIRARIEKAYPNHSIAGEEFGLKETEGSTHRWFIDPIDGTKSFVRGVPLYAVLLGLEIEGKMEVGAVYLPALDEMVAAATGLGCWWNGRRAHVSTIPRLSQGILTCTTTKRFAEYGRQAAWERLLHTCYHQVGWTDAYGYILVATGRAEVMLDPIMAVWDSGPFPPIFREAGGYFGDWQGNPTIYAKEALATTGALLAEVLAVIRGGEEEK